MSSKSEILANIKKNKPTSSIGLVETNIPHMSYENKEEQYSTALSSVGGNAVWLENESIEEFVATNYPDAKVITSSTTKFNAPTKHANRVRTPHALEDVDLAIIQGEFAVAENGAVWVKNPNNKYRALYFLAKQLLIVVKKENLVDTMHEAYERIDFDEAGYGVFISGPSKTADIEQSLVIGAHGPTDACVVFI